MKELSIGEKAKRYDEAYKVAENVYRFSSDPAEIKRMKEIFPELAESEDERIELLNYLYDVHDDDEERARWIAWLEKQGEKGTNGNKGEFPIPEPPLTIKHAKEVMGIEQKPAWSEWDENHVNSLLKRLEGLCRNEFATTRFAINEDEDWLKSLKDRMQPQPKQEWSEEDGRCIRYLIECLEVCVKGTAIKMLPSTAQKYIEWLKSLRPQNSWKPSLAQLNALSIVVKGYEPDDMDALSELLEQLKKLK